ncbi:hypothetical protein SFRURICE_013723 [Spodoptera frugiperda]|nr:hypothetical protein SFRURICE_013723 [Spodoptera frugiperda]
MAGLVKSVVDKYNYVVHDLADPRTADWWAVSNPLVILSISSAYLYFCLSLGPRLMKNRPGFELRFPILLYNIFQVLFSIFLSYEGAVYILNKEYNLACEPVDYSNNPRALRVTELLDTIFFVLRKKYNQVSFLHVYHHTLMSLLIWVGVKYFPGGHIVLMGWLNSMVHVIMYTYYLISSLGPQYQKYVWWKKHVTSIQLIQFCIIFTHNIAVFFYDCKYPRVLNGLCALNSLIFIYLFGKFYIKSYQKENARNKAKLENKKSAPVSSDFRTNRKLVEKSR